LGDEEAVPLDSLEQLRALAREQRFATILADPPWRFDNSTGKVAPGHRRLNRYETLSFAEIERLPISEITHTVAHLYLWVPNALLPQGLSVMKIWGFQYKSNIVWHKIRKDGGRTGEGWDFIFAMSRNCCSSASKVRMRAHWQPGDGR
jgi:N6-adenosine-specific RNA methylase IME4